MPKKPANARGNAQRNRTKAQRSVQLVRANAAAAKNPGNITENEEIEEERTSAVATSVAPAIDTEVDEETVEEVEATPSPAPEVVKSARDTKASKATKEPATPKTSTADTLPVSTHSAPRSASARMAARRQQQQSAVKTRQAANLVTAEHYAYVRRDLILIAVLACIMFGTLIVLAILRV
jgi:hypothetical protein